MSDERQAAEATERPTVAVIGLGAMGLPMATHLAGHMDVTGYDPSPGRAALAADAGLRVAPSPAAAATGAGIVVLCVRTLAQVEGALWAEAGASDAAAGDGVADALPPGAVVVITSTIGSPGARSVAARLHEQGVLTLDLPVSGGPARAGTGDLLAFRGGSDRVVAAAGAVPDLIASTIAVVGPEAGDGQAMKTVNQLLCGVHIAAAAEALALAKGLGIEPARALEALGEGAAASWMLANRGPRIVEALAGGTPEVLSRVDIFEKDLGIVSAAGRDAGVALPVAAAAEQLYRLARLAGLGGDDDGTIATLLGSREPGRP
ncbi:MAG TPA: NAD(P)-dependent oxidoreductase [Acidimicrobiales bacterium]|nr:NAD(P)-dependent oxidoreductase [Acidimicrobiales bacterium]